MRHPFRATIPSLHEHKYELVARKDWAGLPYAEYRKDGKLVYRHMYMEWEDETNCRRYLRQRSKKLAKLGEM